MMHFTRRLSTAHIAFATLLTASFAAASVTGKITGRVTDAETGEPLPGANVLLKGTTLGAATDGKGLYTILNVTGGRYTLIASLIGYKTIELANIVVLTDRTSKVDFRLEIAAVEGEEVTVTAARPVIVRDQTSTTTTVLAEEIEDLPVNSYTDVLTHMAGVIENTNGGGDDGVHIRGGRANEIVYLVDGFVVEDAIYGGMGTDVSRAGISELSVITGAFDAEYGEAMSGVVNILTKEGTPRYTGSFRRTSDGIRPKKSLSNWNTERLEATLSGPVPLIGRWSNFFVAYDQSSTDTYLGKAKHNVAIGPDYDGDNVADPDLLIEDTHDLDGDGDTLETMTKGHLHANATYDNQQRLNAKLSFRPIGSMKLTTGGVFSRGEKRSYYHSFMLLPENVAPTWKESDLFYVNLSHNLSPSTFYTVKWSKFSNRSHSGLEQYLDKNRDLWRTEDLAAINTYWSAAEPFDDANGNGSFDWTDRDGDGVWDRGEGEFFSDQDGDGRWTSYVRDTGADGVFAESFTDANSDATWQPGEPFTDTNGNGIWNGPDDGELDGQPTAGEEGVVGRWWSYNAEPFQDTPDGIYRAGSDDILLFDADGDGAYDPEDGDIFRDLSGDGVWKEGEEFADLNGDGDYNFGISPPFRTGAFSDLSNYEFYGRYKTYDDNGEFVRWAQSEDNSYAKYSSDYESVEAMFTSQVTPAWQFKLGAKHKKLNIRDFYGGGLDGGIWGIASDPSFTLWRKNPVEQALFLHNKFEYEDWVINLGLRWEYLDPKSNYPDPGRTLIFRDAAGNLTEANGKAELYYDEGNGVWNSGEYFIDEDNNGARDAEEIFTDAGNGMWDEGESYVDENEDGIYTGAVAEYGYLGENGEFISPQQAKVKGRLMPRIGVGYPITDRVQFHFSYGHFFQYPEYNNMYQYLNTGNPAIYGNSLWPFPYSLSDWYIPSVGNPNINPEITVAYETGIHWQIASHFVLDLTVFYKDSYDYQASTIFYADPTDYALFLNQDYGNSRGIEFNLRKLFADNFGFGVTYSYSQAVGNAANEYAHWNEAYLASVYGTRPSLKTVIMPWNQPHTFNFTVDYRHPKGFGMTLLGNAGSGLPYTPTDARGQNLAESNSGRMPYTAQVDMKAYQDIRISPVTLRLFLDVTNLFDRRNILNVFDNSGQPDNSLNPNTSLEGEFRPYFYGAPRHVEAGLSITFE